MQSQKVSIWIYNDEGVSETSILSALSTFQKKLSNTPIYSVSTINAQDILAGQLNSLDDKLNTTACLIIPGGADLPYCDKLNGQGNRIIRDFVAEGNIYIGICAGAYYGAREIAFTGDGYEITGSRELSFFEGKAIGSIASLTDGKLYDESTASKAIVTLDFIGIGKSHLHYHGGPYFVGDTDAAFNTIATYPDGKNAIVSGTFGKGQYLLSGVHFELCPNIYEKLNVAVNEDNDTDTGTGTSMKEKQLLAVIDQERYGLLVYSHLMSMIEKILQPSCP